MVKKPLPRPSPHREGEKTGDEVDKVNEKGNGNVETIESLVKTANGKEGDENTLKARKKLETLGIDWKNATVKGEKKTEPKPVQTNDDGDIMFSRGGKHKTEEDEIVKKSKADGMYMKAPNGKPTRLNAKQWVQVRTKAFKDWFGDWELANKKVNIVDSEKIHGFKNFSEAKEWAKQHIVRSYNNKETGGKGNILISNTSIDKFLSESAVGKSEDKDVHLSVLKVLPDVIRESVDAEQHPDYIKGEDGVRRKENGTNPNVLIHRLYGAVEIDGHTYRVKTTIKELPDEPKTDNKVHSYEATKIELLDKDQTAPRSSTSTEAPIEIANLLNGVDKSYEKGKKLLDSSKIVDENGEPLVVYHDTNSTEIINRKTGQNFDDLDWKERDYWQNEASQDEFDKTWKEQNFYKFDNKNARRGIEMPAFFFTPNYDEYHEYGDRTIPAFLNLRNPARDPKIENAGMTDTAGKDYMNKLISEGYDGFIRMDDDGNMEETNAFYPNQVKSATENNGDFSNRNDDIRFSKEKRDIEAVNSRFNEELQKQIDGTLEKGHVYRMGNAGRKLQAGGFPDLPMEMRAKTLIDKSSENYVNGHPFDIEDVKDLPKAMNNPIAVFDSKTTAGSKVVLLDMKDKNGVNFIAAVSTNVPKSRYSRDGIQINDVRSIYPKGNIKDVINWINRGDLLKYADKEKLESWITQQWPNATDLETQTSEVKSSKYNASPSALIADATRNQLSKTSRTTQQWPTATDLEVREQDSKSINSRTTQQRSNSAEVEVREQDLNTAANIVKDFDNVSIFDGKVTRESEKRAIVEETAARTAETLGHEGLKTAEMEGYEFTIPFKSVSTHLGKDEDHVMTAKEWHELPDALQHPFFITNYKGDPKRFRIYTQIKIGDKYVVMGVDVKKINQGKNKPMVEINSIKTVFAKSGKIADDETIVCYDKNITPEQKALLEGHNSHQYPTIQELSDANIAKDFDNASIFEGKIHRVKMAQAIFNGDKQKH